jgi:hypothetical protein
MRTYLTTVIFEDNRVKDRTRKVQASTRSHARHQARAHVARLVAEKGWVIAKVTAEHVPATVPAPAPVQATVPTPVVIATAADESRKAAAQAAFRAVLSLQGGKAAARAYRGVMQADEPELEALVLECEAELAAINS